jgi:asparagine synthase (glutamine-hydrolysing)
MCGIVGEIGPLACDENKLFKMMGMLTHRGPDEAGLMIADGVALGHLRLSIVDLNMGQQPMSSADGRYWIVFNGEIFNHVELRKELQELGQSFATKSDTEVLLQAYQVWGLDFLHRLNGQWAFVLWDKIENSFLLARDRWGIRPLFYSYLSDGKTLVFASEIKAILADERIAGSWNFQVLRDILACWASESDRTPIQSVRTLPPGCYLRIQNERTSVHKWWEIDYSPAFIEWNRSDESWSEELRETLGDACRIRLRADVPVGAYLSGGLDSSITTLMARVHHKNRLRTFSIAFDDHAYDESSFQKMMADHLGTEHSNLNISRDLIASSFEQAIWHAETPIYRTAPIPMMHLSKLVHDSGFKVVLTGEGADELFGGYDQFKEDKVRRFWARNPASLWRKRLLERLETTTPRTGSRTRAFWFAFYQKKLTETGARGYSHFIRWHNGISLWPLLCDSAGAVEDGSDARSRWIGSVVGAVPMDFDIWPTLSKAMYWETRQLLSGYLLSSQGDRVAMANSVEGRYPFLDVRMYELARRMPPDLKLRALQEKYILKRAFKSKLPAEITKRIKNPYRAPDALALYHGNLREKVMASLSPYSVRRHGIFRSEGVAKLLDRLKATEQPSALDNMALVFIYSSHVFQDLFIEREMIPKTLPPVHVYADLRSRTEPFSTIPETSHDRIQPRVS